MSLVALARKPVHTIEPHQTMAEAARRMMEHTVGALVVTDATGKTPEGLVTDRDLVAMMARGFDPTRTSLASLPVPPIQTMHVDDTITDVIAKMKEYAIRRMPVVDDGGSLVGLVSMDDLLVLLGQEMSDLAAAVSTELAYEPSYEQARSSSHNPSHSDLV